MTNANHRWKRQFEGIAGTVISLPIIFLVLVEYYALSQARRPFAGRRASVSSATVGIGCLALVLLIAVGDHLASGRINFALFYLLVAAYAAWSGGRKTGIFIAVVSAFADCLNQSGLYSPLGNPLWNFVLQLAVIGFVVLLIAAFRESTTRLEQRVRERSAALESEINDRLQTGEQLSKVLQQLRQLAENIDDAFWIRNVDETRLVYVSPAYEKVWGRSCKSVYQSADGWAATIHPEDRPAVVEAMRARSNTGDYHLQYRILRPDGSIRWIRDRACPIRDQAGKIIRFVGIAEDFTGQRLLEREILEISDREQARMGQDLHDGLCQQLVSLGFDSNALEQSLAERGLPEAAFARKMGKLLDDVITEARALSRGLFPVQLEADGLSVALQQLAAGVNARANIRCEVDCPQSVFVQNNTVAIHLYRLAQEAVNNAVKHSQGRSISIQLSNQSAGIELRISDDGVGFADPGPSAGGMGIHIMKYRAQAVGGRLTITPAMRRGTVVMCFVPQPSA